LHRLVRLVATGAARVLRRREHRLVLVTARARRDLLLRELMRCVATRALRVAMSSLLRVAGRTALIRDQRELVHRVAVAATSLAGVLGVLLVGVARLARLRLERRRRMRAVAVAAGLVGVRTDRRARALRLGMAAHAVRRHHGRVVVEAVAIQAARQRLVLGRRIQRVERRLHRVTARAHLGRRLREAALAVTVLAVDVRLADVRRVAGARAHVAPGARHLLRGGRPALARTRARGDHREKQRVLHRVPSG